MIVNETNKVKLSSKTKALNTVRSIFKNIFFERIICYFTQGKTASNVLIKILPNNYQYPKHSFRKVTRNGISYILDISDLVDWHVYFGIKDKAHEELYKLCSNGDVVLDVGTNIGCVLMNLAQKTGENGAVYGFEPDTINYNKCINNLKLNNFKNINVETFGLGEKKEDLFLVVHSEQNRGMNRIGNVNESNGKSISISTIDDFAESKSIKKLDLIKIDVEGFEFNVLKGANKTITTFQPVLFIELDDENLKAQGTSAKAFVTYLKNTGYVIFHAENEFEITENYNFDKCHFDIICKYKNATASI